MSAKQTVIEFRELVDACVARMKELLDAAHKEARDITADEEVEYRRLDAGIDRCNDAIAKYAKIIALEEESARSVRSLPFQGSMVNFQREKDWGPNDFGEFLHAVRFNNHDPRLEYREQQMQVGADMGIMVPSVFIDQIMSFPPQIAVVRSRAQVIPAGVPPDAELTIPALNQSTDQNMFGGITLTWVSEGQAPSGATAKMGDLKLQPNEVAAYVVVTNKLLNNWTAAGIFIQNLLRKAAAAGEDYQFLRGNGVGKPQGAIGSKCEIAYKRATADTIVYADVVGMLERARGEAGHVWVASRTCLPQLANIRDTGNNNLFIINASLGTPANLFGIPLVWNERSPVLGSKGDLMLADFSYYLIKDGSGPFIAASEHVYFQQSKTVIKLSWCVDGKPWPQAPLQLEGSSAASATVSPFVVLDVP